VLFKARNEERDKGSLDQSEKHDAEKHMVITGRLDKLKNRRDLSA